MFFKIFSSPQLKSFPAIRRPDTKPDLRPDTEINHRLNFPYSPRSSRTSLLVDATLGSRPTPRTPPAPPFLFLPFPLFPFLLFLFSFFFFPSPFFLLLLPAPCPRAASCAPTRRTRAPTPTCSTCPGMLATPLAPARPVSSPCARLAARNAAL